jgi:membrane protease subunit HflC
MGVTRLVTLITGAVLVVGTFSSLFTVNQTQQALVLQFGEPKRTIQEPGLAFKLPFIQDVTYYEKRVLSLIPQDAEEVILSDQKRLQVDAYARYRIEDPLLFYQTVRDERGARGRLEAIIDSSVRRALGSETLASILTGQRNDITRSIGEEVNASVSSLGIQIIDVRLRRADYPTATSQNIFNRMKSEREREAKEFRATGEEEAQKIRADAEKTRTVIISEAQREAQEKRGAGDAEAIQIYADSFGQDTEFFAFYRSMEAYRKSMGSNDTSMILSPDSSFFRFFKDKSGAPQN